MSVPFQKQIERVRSWPRAARIAVVAGAVIVGWILCRDTVWSWAGSLSEEAGELRELLDRGRDQTARRLPAVKDAVVAHGPVQPPRRSTEGSALLSQVAAGILQSAGVNYSYKALSNASIPQSALRDAVGSNQRVQRAMAEIQFEASPEVVTKVIAAFEASPDIDAVSKVQIQRLDPSTRKVRVLLTIEAWVIAADAPARSLT